jgi:TP901 family phage tail tape measure protein
MAKNETIYSVNIKGTTELIQLRKTIDETERSLNKLKKQKNQNKETTDRQIKGLDHLERKLKTSRKKYNGLNKEIQNTNKTTKSGIGFIGKMAGAFTVATLAAGAFQKMSRAVSQAIVGSVETFRQFEFAMSKVRAISGATSDEFLKLDKSAQDLGRSTFFTATEVANLQLNFSKLGFTSAEVLNAQEGALMAATATGEDLARTATVIGSTIRGFGLDASEAGRVADVMSASFTGSALTLEKFQTAMTKVAPVAKILGMSLEETTATLGVLTDSGIEASIAGTSLRNIFLKLGDPSSDLAKSIGFTVNSGQEMVAQFKRMAAEGVNVEKMLKIVDVRQVAAISTMIENVDVLERQIVAYEGAEGAAKRMADIVGDNLEGSTRRLKSAMDGLAIILVEKIAPALSSVINGFTSLFTAVSDVSDNPLSESMEKERIQMNANVISITRLKEGTQDRKTAIANLQLEYPKYFGNLDLETAKNSQLKTALGLANEQYINKITLMKQEEKLNKSIDKAAQARLDKFNSEQKANSEAIRLNKEYNLGITDFGSTVDEQFSKVEAAFAKRFDYMDEEREDLVLLSQSTLLNRKASKELEEHTLRTTELTEEKKKLAKQLGIELELNKKNDVVTETREGSPANTDKPKVIEDATALQDAELAILNQKQSILQQFADGEIQTKAELNQQLKEMEIEHLQWVIDNNLAAGEELMTIEQRLLQAKVDSKVETQKGEVDRIEQMKETGKLLMEIGKAEGENSKARLIGIKISQASAVASGIEAIIEAKGAITSQAAGGDPFTAFFRVAAMAAQMASVISSIKGLMGGSDKFEQGGLTNGGMFKGSSHANGGVKFAVGGRIHEAEGGEAIINKRSTAMFKPMLSAMNQAGGGVKFANGGFLSTGEKFAMGGELANVQDMISGGGGTTQVIMVESDVTQTQGRVSAIESQATF